MAKEPFEENLKEERICQDCLSKVLIVRVKRSSIDLCLAPREDVYKFNLRQLGSRGSLL